MQLQIWCDDNPLLQNEIRESDNEVVLDITCGKDTGRIKMELQGDWSQISFKNRLKYYVLDKFCRRTRCTMMYYRFEYFMNYDTKDVVCKVDDTQLIIPAFKRCTGKNELSHIMGDS